ncbi:MAG: AbrB/MazE/SpoVT family DNA-binding domain-containing protein [Methanomethylovorans sp.]|nr:AbrB/MazE/SpoVT family DNA-binding domain-containing protein [Methanomethylovorans sp.]
MSKVKIQESSGRLSITIPKSIADLKGWKKGTTLELKEHAGYVCLIEVRN